MIHSAFDMASLKATCKLPLTRAVTIMSIPAIVQELQSMNILPKIHLDS